MQFSGNFLSNTLFKNSRSQLTQICRKMSQKQDDIILETTKSAGVIILNRPKQLNALNTSMVEKIVNAINDWSSTKKLILVKGAGGKSFCAGGDVKLIAEHAHAGNYRTGDEFFTKEYYMNGLIGSLQIPYISLIDGITMGGGVGLSIHGSYRIATETTLFAMPETKIGFFPDVGASYWMPRLSCYLGLYLALTGQRLKGPSVYHAGIATHYVERENLDLLEKELLECGNHKEVKMTLERYHKETNDEQFILTPHLDLIEEIFSGYSVESILEKLSQKSDSKWAEETLKQLKAMCPTSLKVAQKAYYKGRSMNLNQCLEMELIAAKHSLRSYNFYEGIRALLISKDNNPKWKPASLEEVKNEEVDNFFEDSIACADSKL